VLLIDFALPLPEVVEAVESVVSPVLTSPVEVADSASLLSSVTSSEVRFDFEDEDEDVDEDVLLIDFVLPLPEVVEAVESVASPATGTFASTAKQAVVVSIEAAKAVKRIVIRFILRFSLGLFLKGTRYATLTFEGGPHRHPSGACLAWLAFPH
jgi:hypothetical protein